MKQPRKPVVYLVHWPDVNVIKAGISMQKRWRAFVKRGGIVVDLVEFDDYADAAAFETVVHNGLRQYGSVAFDGAAEAIPYLGGSGGGWAECFTIPAGVGPKELLRSINWSAT